MKKELKLQYIKLSCWIAGVIGILGCAFTGWMNYQLRYLPEQHTSDLMIYVIGIPLFTTILIIVFLCGGYQIVKKCL